MKSVLSKPHITQDSAKAALELHNQELEPGLPMSVYISDPDRRKERTDSDANDREVYVAGLAKSVTRQDLEKLFSAVRICCCPVLDNRHSHRCTQYGSIKDIRLATDEKGQTKGFAFVEFEQDVGWRTELTALMY